METKKGGFRENTSLKSRLKTQESVVQVLPTKKNIFLFELENRGTKKTETVVVSEFSGAISFLVAQPWYEIEKRTIHAIGRQASTHNQKGDP